MTVLMLDADVEADTAPPQLVASETVTLDGAMVALENPEPVTLTFVIPATPALGEVAEFSLMTAEAEVARDALSIATTQESKITIRPAVGKNALILFRQCTWRVSKMPTRPVIRRNRYPGSGTEVPLMTAKSWSCKVVPELDRIEAVKLGANAKGTVGESNSVTAVGLNIPVKVAWVGWGLAPSIAMTLPSKDKPSEPGVKYDDPKVIGKPLENSTVKLRLDSETAVITGQVGSFDEFGPV